MCPPQQKCHTSHTTPFYRSYGVYSCGNRIALSQYWPDRSLRERIHWDIRLTQKQKRRRLISDLVASSRIYVYMTAVSVG